MLRRHLTPTRLGMVLAVIAGVVLGAVFGQPSSGRAATSAAPTNKTLPTITGTAEGGLTLKAGHGSWTGNPGSYSYAWSRCAADGTACVAIPGATARIYTLTDSDVGHTLRVTVTARNADGTGHATSAPTSIVSPSGCPPGTGVIQVAQLGPPARLMIGGATVSAAITRATRTIDMHIQITACSGRPVQGATVFAVPIPYNQFQGAAVNSGADGMVTITESRRSGFPASPRQRLLAVFVRATKSGEPANGGVSGRRVVSFHISH
jgi:hypothetical protein